MGKLKSSHRQWTPAHILGPSELLEGYPSKDIQLFGQGLLTTMKHDG
jgi:hypothetical protein